VAHQAQPLPECPFVPFLSPEVIHGAASEEEQMVREIFENSGDKECEEENENAHLSRNYLAQDSEKEERPTYIA